MRTRLTLYAEEGMVLTDGAHFGRVVTLAEGEGAGAWHEITEAEHDEIKSERDGGEV